MANDIETTCDRSDHEHDSLESARACPTKDDFGSRADVIERSYSDEWVDGLPDAGVTYVERLGVGGDR